MLISSDLSREALDCLLAQIRAGVPVDHNITKFLQAHMMLQIELARFPKTLVNEHLWNVKNLGNANNADKKNPVLGNVDDTKTGSAVAFLDNYTQASGDNVVKSKESVGIHAKMEMHLLVKIRKEVLGDMWKGYIRYFRSPFAAPEIDGCRSLLLSVPKSVLYGVSGETLLVAESTLSQSVSGVQNNSTDTVVQHNSNTDTVFNRHTEAFISDGLFAHDLSGSYLKECIGCVRSYVDCLLHSTSFSPEKQLIQIKGVPIQVPNAVLFVVVKETRNLLVRTLEDMESSVLAIVETELKPSSTHAKNNLDTRPIARTEVENTRTKLLNVNEVAQHQFSAGTGPHPPSATIASGAHPATIINQGSEQSDVPVIHRALSKQSKQSKDSKRDYANLTLQSGFANTSLQIGPLVTMSMGTIPTIPGNPDTTRVNQRHPTSNSVTSKKSRRSRGGSITNPLLLGLHPQPTASGGRTPPSRTSSQQVSGWTVRASQQGVGGNANIIANQSLSPTNTIPDPQIMGKPRLSVTTNSSRASGSSSLHDGRLVLYVRVESPELQLSGYNVSDRTSGNPQNSTNAQNLMISDEQSVASHKSKQSTASTRSGSKREKTMILTTQIGIQCVSCLPLTFYLSAVFFLLAFGILAKEKEFQIVKVSRIRWQSRKFGGMESSVSGNRILNGVDGRSLTGADGRTLMGVDDRTLVEETILVDPFDTPDFEYYAWQEEVAVKGLGGGIATAHAYFCKSYKFPHEACQMLFLVAFGFSMFVLAHISHLSLFKRAFKSPESILTFACTWNMVTVRERIYDRCGEPSFQILNLLASCVFMVSMPLLINCIDAVDARRRVKISSLCLQLAVLLLLIEPNPGFGGVMSMFEGSGSSTRKLIENFSHRSLFPPFIWFEKNTLAEHWYGACGYLTLLISFALWRLVIEDYDFAFLVGECRMISQYEFYKGQMLEDLQLVKVKQFRRARHRGILVEMTENCFLRFCCLSDEKKMHCVYWVDEKILRNPWMSVWNLHLLNWEERYVQSDQKFSRQVSRDPSRKPSLQGRLEGVPKRPSRNEPQNPTKLGGFYNSEPGDGAVEPEPASATEESAKGGYQSTGTASNFQLVSKESTKEIPPGKRHRDSQPGVPSTGKTPKTSGKESGSVKSDPTACITFRENTLGRKSITPGTPGTTPGMGEWSSSTRGKSAEQGIRRNAAAGLKSNFTASNKQLLVRRTVGPGGVGCRGNPLSTAANKQKGKKLVIDHPSISAFYCDALVVPRKGNFPSWFESAAFAVAGGAGGDVGHNLYPSENSIRVTVASQASGAMEILRDIANSTQSDGASTYHLFDKDSAKPRSSFTPRNIAEKASGLSSKKSKNGSISRTQQNAQQLVHQHSDGQDSQQQQVFSQPLLPGQVGLDSSGPALEASGLVRLNSQASEALVGSSSLAQAVAIQVLSVPGSVLMQNSTNLQGRTCSKNSQGSPKQEPMSPISQKLRALMPEPVEVRSSSIESKRGQRAQLENVISKVETVLFGVSNLVTIEIPLMLAEFLVLCNVSPLLEDEDNRDIFQDFLGLPAEDAAVLQEKREKILFKANEIFVGTRYEAALQDTSKKAITDPGKAEKSDHQLRAEEVLAGTADNEKIENTGLVLAVADKAQEKHSDVRASTERKSGFFDSLRKTGKSLTPPYWISKKEVHTATASAESGAVVKSPSREFLAAANATADAQETNSDVVRRGNAKKNSCVPVNHQGVFLLAAILGIPPPLQSEPYGDSARTGSDGIPNLYNSSDADLTNTGGRSDSGAGPERAVGVKPTKNFAGGKLNVAAVDKTKDEQATSIPQAIRKIFESFCDQMRAIIEETRENEDVAGDLKKIHSVVGSTGNVSTQGQTTQRSQKKLMDTGKGSMRLFAEITSNFGEKKMLPLMKLGIIHEISSGGIDPRRIKEKDGPAELRVNRSTREKSTTRERKSNALSITDKAGREVSKDRVWLTTLSKERGWSKDRSRSPKDRGWTKKKSKGPEHRPSKVKDIDGKMIKSDKLPLQVLGRGQPIRSLDGVIDPVPIIGSGRISSGLAPSTNASMHSSFFEKGNYSSGFSTPQSGEGPMRKKSSSTTTRRDLKILTRAVKKVVSGLPATSGVIDVSGVTSSDVSDAGISSMERSIPESNNLFSNYPPCNKSRSNRSHSNHPPALKSSYFSSNDVVPSRVLLKSKNQTEEFGNVSFLFESSNPVIVAMRKSHIARVIGSVLLILHFLYPFVMENGKREIYKEFRGLSSAELEMKTGIPCYCSEYDTDPVFRNFLSVLFLPLILYLVINSAARDLLILCLRSRATFLFLICLSRFFILKEILQTYCDDKIQMGIEFLQNPTSGPPNGIISSISISESSIRSDFEIWLARFSYVLSTITLTVFVTGVDAFPVNKSEKLAWGLLITFLFLFTYTHHWSDSSGSLANTARNVTWKEVVEANSASGIWKSLWPFQQGGELLNPATQMFGASAMCMLIGIYPVFRHLRGHDFAFYQAELELVWQEEH